MADIFEQLNQLDSAENRLSKFENMKSNDPEWVGILSW
jgi:hypothetical protein